MTSVIALSAACGGAAADAAEPQEVKVTLHDFGITLDSTALRAGAISFSLENEGPSVHEFVVLASDEDPASFPVENGEVEESALDAVDEVEDVAVGATPSLEVDLEPGSYVVICNITGHYAAGMHAGFEVA